MKKNKEIERFLHQMIHHKYLAGASYAFFTPNFKETYYDGVMGCIEPFDHRRLEEGLLYDLASLTKVVATTTRILQMINEKKLQLSTPVCEILSEYRYQSTTIEDMLLHRSGLPAEVIDKQLLTKETIREKVYDTNIENEMIHQTCYSDVGFILLGFVIEKLDQLSLEESFQKHIAKPLEMEHTSYHVYNKQKAIPTEITNERGCICGEVHDSKAYLLGESGSASLFSTLQDLVCFGQAMLSENNKLFEKEIFELLKSVTIQRRGLGWEKPYKESVLYHTGFTGTSILLDMDKKQGFILLTNRIHPDRNQTDFLVLRNKLNKIYLEE